MSQIVFFFFSCILKIYYSLLSVLKVLSASIHQIKELARKFDITVAWFYGKAGHRKGLGDAMSSFGCKEPITNAIITEDKWFQNASKIVSYLKEHFNHDPSKEHHHIDAASLAECLKWTYDKIFSKVSSHCGK